MYLFVYGTLKRGQRNHPLLKGAEFLDTGITAGRIYSVGSFPALTLPKSHREYVQGEIYRITPEMLPRLDRLEGVPHMYTREEQQVWGDGDDRRESVQAYVYVWARSTDHMARIDSGIWE